MTTVDEFEVFQREDRHVLHDVITAAKLSPTFFNGDGLGHWRDKSLGQNIQWNEDFIRIEQTIPEDLMVYMPHLMSDRAASQNVHRDKFIYEEIQVTTTTPHDIDILAGKVRKAMKDLDSKLKLITARVDREREAIDRYFVRMENRPDRPLWWPEEHTLIFPINERSADVNVDSLPSDQRHPSDRFYYPGYPISIDLDSPHITHWLHDTADETISIFRADGVFYKVFAYDLMEAIAEQKKRVGKK